MVDISPVLKTRFCKFSAFVRFNKRQQSNVTILAVRAQFNWKTCNYCQRVIGVWGGGVGVNPLMAVACRTFPDPIPLRRQQADLSLHDVYMWAALVAVWFIDGTDWIVFDRRNNIYNHLLLTDPIGVHSQRTHDLCVECTASRAQLGYSLS